jgi:hypothetical protein
VDFDIIPGGDDGDHLLSPQVALFFVAFFFVAGIGLLSIIHSVAYPSTCPNYLHHHYLSPTTGYIVIKLILFSGRCCLMSS